MSIERLCSSVDKQSVWRNQVVKQTVNGIDSSKLLKTSGSKLSSSFISNYAMKLPRPQDNS